MTHRGKPVFNAQFCAKVGEGIPAELSPVIRHNDSENSKAINDGIKMNFWADFSLIDTASASTHFMKYLITINKNLCCAKARGKGLIISIPHCLKGQANLWE